MGSYPFSFDELLTGSVLIPAQLDKSGAEQMPPAHRAAAAEAGRGAAAAVPAEEAAEAEEDVAFFGVLETNVTTSLGQTAFLRCRLRNLQHQVSYLGRVTSMLRADYRAFNLDLGDLDPHERLAYPHFRIANVHGGRTIPHQTRCRYRRMDPRDQIPPKKGRRNLLLSGNIRLTFI